MALGTSIRSHIPHDVSTSGGLYVLGMRVEFLAQVLNWKGALSMRLLQQARV